MTPAPRRGPSSMLVPLVVVAAAAGVAVGWSLAARQQYKKGYDEAYAAAKEKLAKSQFFQSIGQLRSLNGKVKEVRGMTMDIEVPQLERNPLEDPAPLLRHVLITSDTKIALVAQKSPEKMKADLDAYDAAVRKYQEEQRNEKAPNLTAQPPAPPVPFEESRIDVGKIKAGDQVFVVSAADVTRAESFAATEVRVVRGGSPGSPEATSPGALPPPGAPVPPPGSGPNVSPGNAAPPPPVPPPEP